MSYCAHCAEPVVKLSFGTLVHVKGHTVFYSHCECKCRKCTGMPSAAVCVKGEIATEPEYNRYDDPGQTIYRGGAL